MQAILFDYGGTLDSRGDHWSEVICDAWLAVLPALPYDAFRPAYIHAEQALAAPGAVAPSDTFLDLMRKKIALQADYLAAHGIIEAPALSERVARRCYDSAREAVAEARPLLAALAARYPLGLVSNFYGNLPAVLADMQLSDLFPVVVESAAVGLRKPDPAIFALACRRLGFAPADVLVVGDSVSKDIIPAASLGCPTALIAGRPWRGSPAPALHSTTLAALTLSLLTGRPDLSALLTSVN